VEDLETETALDHLALLADDSHDHGRPEELQRALRIGKELEKRDLTRSQACRLHYVISNVWGYLYDLQGPQQTERWDWEQPCIERQILHLRRALADLSPSPGSDLACRVHTNLANAFDSIGRIVEAFEHWDKALKLDPSFGMAHGNLGIGLCCYAEHLYDRGHAVVLVKAAHEHVTKAEQSSVRQSFKDGLAKHREQIERFLDRHYNGAEIRLDGFELGSTQEEVDYRKWCLQNRLFLNPLNDLGPYSIAGRDILTQPSIVVGIDDGPYYAGFFNQMKQEFVSARLLLFEGMQAAGPHYSDGGVTLYDTLDYPCYGLNVEKVKAAFRVGYSVFDKIAFFLNHYLKLDIQPRRVSFKTLWYEGDERLRPLFVGRKNLPLRGLFWLSKDLFEDRKDFKESMEPEAQELKKIRNHIEHRYLKLHEDLWRGPNEKENRVLGGFTDTLAHSLYFTDFQKKTLKILKLARAGLVYLSLAVRIEERVRASEADEGTTAMPMTLQLYEDGWKR